MFTFLTSALSYIMEVFFLLPPVYLFLILIWCGFAGIVPVGREISQNGYQTRALVASVSLRNGIFGSSF